MNITNKQKVILDLSKKILAGEKLPDFTNYFGKGFSERRVEVPWVAQKIKNAKTVLDIGFTFASLEYLGLLLYLKKVGKVNLDATDILSPKRVKGRYPKEWLKDILETDIYIGDVRSLNFAKTNHYDVVTCVSTIEHIGFDEPTSIANKSSFKRGKTPEDVNMNRDKNTNRAVLDNVWDILKPKGRLLISVPMGRGGASLLKDSLGLYCAQWEYEKESWQEITGHDNYELEEERFFGLSDQGWQEVCSPDNLLEKTSWLKPHAAGCAVCSLIKKP
jgi:SAM-dependent methyltransferase